MSEPSRTLVPILQAVAIIAPAVYTGNATLPEYLKTG